MRLISWYSSHGLTLDFFVIVAEIDVQSTANNPQELEL